IKKYNLKYIKKYWRKVCQEADQNYSSLQSIQNSGSNTKNQNRLRKEIKVESYCATMSYIIRFLVSLKNR
ncbi:MAG: hypothetical protein OXE99_03940, partial [Cellvibrionales bacterium]|nr:hypothetical protein [Cellvibrionales bacterium]